MHRSYRSRPLLPPNDIIGRMTTRMTPVVYAWDDGHRIEPATHEYRVSPNVDLSLSGLTDYYGGLTDAFPAQKTAAAVFAMSMVSRAFASAEVRPAAFAQTLSAPVRAMIGLEMMLRGEFLGEIDVGAAGGLVIYPGYGGVRSGGRDPATWRYELKFALPGDDAEPLTRNVASNGVVHVRDNVSVLQPWKGVSRLELSGMSADALANIEGRLGHDARTRVMHIIPVPDGIPAARVTDVGNSLRASKRQRQTSRNDNRRLGARQARGAVTGLGASARWARDPAGKYHVP